MGARGGGSKVCAQKDSSSGEDSYFRTSSGRMVRAIGRNVIEGRGMGGGGGGKKCVYHKRPDHIFPTVKSIAFGSAPKRG